MYFENTFPEGFAVSPDPALVNRPRYIHPEGLKQVPAPGKPLDPAAFAEFVQAVCAQIAEALGLTKRN